METQQLSDNSTSIVAKPLVLIHTPEGSFPRLHHQVAADPRAEIVRAESVAHALDLLASSTIKLCFLDIRAGGIEVVRDIRRLRKAARVVILAAESDADDAVRSMRVGADDYLAEPINESRVRELVNEAVADAATCASDRFYGVLSRHPRMHNLFALVEDVGPTTTTVLIQGETGTGKEQLARAVHAASAGRTGPFVAINCAAVPEMLLESELFGHEKGSFTGAERQRIGKFEVAHGGTMFLDEVGDVPPVMQVKLLRVLQERRFERVGGSDPIRVDVRVIAATNRPLRKMVQAGRFREDLYYRLNVVRMDLPPLRRRPDDVPLLAAHFCRKYSRPGREPKRLSPATLVEFAHYPWPGNVRELENTIERACVVNPTDVIEPAHLPPEFHRVASGVLPPQIDIGTPLKDLIRDTVARLEKRYITKVLKRTHGHVGRAAKLCGYCRRSLTAKIAEYGIDRHAYLSKN